LLSPVLLDLDFLQALQKSNCSFPGTVSTFFLCLFEFVRYIGYKMYALTKCSNRFDCLIEEMLLIRKPKPSLSVQNSLDSRKGIHLKNLRSFVIMLICRACKYRDQILASIYSFCIEEGVTITPRRRLLTLILACLCSTKAILIKPNICNKLC